MQPQAVPPSRDLETEEVADALLEEAKALLAAGRFAESEECFERLLVYPGRQVAAAYGIGAARLGAGRLDAAEACFHQALALDRSNANALYQLGVIAERRLHVSQARSYYELALGILPSHAGALERLQALRTRESASGAAQGPALYEYLQHEPTPLARQTLAALDALEMRVRPLFSAYLGRRLVRYLLAGALPVVAALLVSALAAGGTLQVSSGAARALVLVAVAAVAAALIVCFARVRATVVTVERGRLQVRSGLLARRLVNVELWRVLEIELERSVWNRLSGDGTILLETSGRGTLSLTGLARGDRLEQIYQGLLNAVFLLRSNPMVKGIVQ